MKKNNRRPVAHTMPRHESPEAHEPPSPQAMIERRKAQDAADKNPLAFAMGEPLPGRSALDKLRAKQKMDIAQAAGDDDTIIVLDTGRSRGITERASPGKFITDGRTTAHRTRS